MVRRNSFAIVTVFVIAICVAVFASNAFAKEYKIGYVDLAKVSDEYGKTKEYEKSFEAKLKDKDAERQKLVDEIRKMKDEQTLLSDKAKADKQVVIDNKIKNLQEFDRSVREDLMKQRNQMLSEIQKDIDSVISSYAKESGYDIVLIKQMVLYAGSDFDLTSEVIKRLNASKR